MNRKQKLTITGCAVFVSLALSYAVQRETAQPAIQRKAASLDTRHLNQIPQRRPSPEELPQKLDKSCMEGMLSSIAGKCDRTCVVNFIKDRDSELYNFLTGNEQSRYGRFYKITTTQPDEKLEKILAEVSQEDNDNAFPALFHAVILMEIKKPAEALRVYQEALKRKSYVNYGPLIRKKLKQLTVHDDQLFAQAILISELEPDMIGPYSYDHFIGLNNELRLKLGRILVRAPLKDEGKNAFLNWSPADYIYGRDIIEELDPMALTTFNDIESTMEREEEDFPQYYNFDCHEKDFFIYHKLEKERLLGNE